MENHIRPLGIVFVVFGGLGVIAAVFLLLLFLAGGTALAGEDLEAARVVTIIGLTVAVFATIISLPNIIAGYGLIKERPWGRILALVLSFLNLPGFPVGTALGVYGIVVLFDERVKQRFQPQPRYMQPPRVDGQASA